MVSKAMLTGILEVITSAIKAVSPSGAATFVSADKFDNSNVVDFMKSAIDPTKTVKNMNLEVQASKSIAYYPVFFTNSVNQATAGVITKMLERRIAEMIRLIISRNDYIDMTKANSKEEVIRQFRGAVFIFLKHWHPYFLLFCFGIDNLILRDTIQPCRNVFNRVHGIIHILCQLIKHILQNIIRIITT
jgi:hypothetical protein